MRCVRAQVTSLSASRQALLRRWLLVGDGCAETDRRRLVAYVVPREAPADESQDWDELIAQWRDVHDVLYAAAPRDQSRAGFNTAGWLSSYDSAPIPADAMQEWRDATLARILECKPQRVLEIGCGTGLLLLPLASVVTSYLGTDVSDGALEAIRRSGLPPSAELRRQAAHDWAGIEPESLDTIVLNSVVQYFPSVHYLLRVLEGAWRSLRPGGHVFLGDIRNLDLLATFRLTVEMERGSPREDCAVLRRRIAHAVEHERELALAPGFFHCLAQTLPQLGGLEVQPKRGRAFNELTRFRYDVVLQRGARARAATSTVELDWQRDGCTVDGLRGWIETCDAQLVTVRRIPVSRLAHAVRCTELLGDAGCPQTAGELSGAPLALQPIDIEDVVVPGYNMRLRYSDLPGAYDIILARESGLWTEAPLELAGPAQAFANDPMRAVRLQRLGEALKQDLCEKLPAHMVPSSFVFIDQLPRTASGKVDRRALPGAQSLQPDDLALHQQPRSDVELRLARIWEQVLGCQRIGVHANFFDLGGHSLLATQLVSRVCRTFGVELPLRTLFEGPTIEAQALAVEELLLAEIESLTEQDAQALAEGPR